jgi:hypothetical protein
MIAEKIGRTLLNAYNEKYEKYYSAREFFENEYFEYFYAHEKYMQWVINSPFVQGLEGFGEQYAFIKQVKGDNGKGISFDNTQKEKFLQLIADFKKKYDDSLLGFKIKPNKEFVIYKESDIDKYFDLEKGKGIKEIKIAFKLNKNMVNKKLQDFIEKAESVKDPDASIAIGYPATEGATSGQVTTIQIPYSSDVIYLSWIGSGCAIGIEGGLSIYFDNKEVLLSIYEGWKIYREKYLNNNAYKKLSVNQIDSWNGQWISFCLKYQNDKELDYNEFNPIEADKNKNLRIKSQSWLKVVFALAKKFENTKKIGYVFCFGKSNKTIGFIQFNFIQVNKPIQLYRKLFGEQEFLDNAKIIEEIYGNPKGFSKACEFGSIGIKALKPQDLEAYVYPDKNGDILYPNLEKPKERKPKKNESPEQFAEGIEKQNNDYIYKIINFQTHISWIISMLNTTETIWEKAGKYAKVLLDFEAGGKSISTSRGNKVEQILKQPFKGKFIEALISLLEEGGVDAHIINELAEETDKLPKDNFAYFLTLIRFKYAYLTNISKQPK